MKALSLLFLCCWVMVCCRNKACSMSLNRENVNLFRAPPGQLFVRLTWLQSAEPFYLLKDKMYRWLTAWNGHNAALWQQWGRRKTGIDCWKGQIPTAVLGRKRTKGDLSLDIRHEALVAQVRPVFTTGKPQIIPSPSLYICSLLGAVVNVSAGVDRVLGRRVACVLGLFSSIPFKKGALFKIGLTPFTVACHRLAIMVSTGFATDYVNLQQINYLLAQDYTHTTL